jgi:hypothetical protein
VTILHLKQYPKIKIIMVIFTNEMINFLRRKKKLLKF